MDVSASATPRPSWVPLRRAWDLFRRALSAHDHDFTEGRLGLGVALLAIPMVLEPLLESVFLVVDVLFVAQLGADAVAAVGLTEALLTLVYTVAVGLSFPVTALVARHIGERAPERAAAVAVQTNLLALVAGLALAVPGGLLARWGLGVMGASPSVLEVGANYAAITLASAPILVGLVLNAAIFRGAGDPSVALRALWLANGLNLVLDPCFIFGLGPFPELGVTGAAVATLLGRGVGLAYLLWQLARSRQRFRITRAELALDLPVLRELLRNAVGGVGQLLIETSSWVFLARVVAFSGSAAVAGYTIALRILVFALMPAWGLSNAAATLVGQNLGAGKPERAARSVLITGLYNMAFLGAITVVFAVWAEPLVRLFTTDPALVPTAATGLRIVGYGYVFYAWGMVFVQAFNGAGDTRTPTLVNLACFWLTKLPLAYVLAVPFALHTTGVFVAILVAYTLNAVLGAWLFWSGRWRRVGVAG